MSKETIEKQFEIEFNQAEVDSQRYWNDCLVSDYLYHNQKKDPEAFSDPLTFRTVNTIQAALYTDQQKMEFAPVSNGDSDIEKSDDWNGMWQYDYHKNNWKALLKRTILSGLLYEHGLIDAYEFNSKMKSVDFKMINMKNVYIDTRADSINGRGGGKSARYLGWVVSLTKSQIEGMDGTMKDLSSLDKHTRNARNERKQETDVMDQKDTNVDTENKVFDIVKWYTWRDGKRVRQFFHNKELILEQELERQDRWQICEFTINTEPTGFRTQSLPKLCEPAHKQMANLLTAALINAEFNSIQTYIINSDAGVDDTDFQYDRFGHLLVPGGAAAVQPMQKQPIFGEIYNLLPIVEQTAQGATATPDVQQGITSGTTATEIANVIEKSNTRIFLYADELNLCIKDMMDEWYWHINNTGAEISKIKRIEGKPIEIKVSDVRLQDDPDIIVESKIIKEGELQRRAQNISNYINQGASIFPDNMDRGGTMEVYGKALSLDIKTIKSIFPDSDQENIQLKENKELRQNKEVKVETWHDHREHLRKMEGEDMTIPKMAKHHREHKEMWFRQIVKENEANQQPPQVPQSPERAAPDFMQQTADAVLPNQK